ncbi:MAG TPA: hypothetical protein EYQ69_02215 [Gemmatimonadetes bacterium]|jgi:hypothetical protein|nr:hypothetical protein [Gemmatimonadota bacterium]
MQLTKYGFENAVAGFFEMPTNDATKILPKHLQSLEIQHQRSILAITAFKFTETEVGSYNEIVLSIIVPPKVDPNKPIPNAAFYPFMVGVTTAESRAHAIERWHLPHYMKDIDIEFTESQESLLVQVHEKDKPILDLTVTDFSKTPDTLLFNAFTTNKEDAFKVNIFMQGQHSEHEEETGSLKLYPHQMTEGLDLDDISTIPFREQWFQQGLQTFEELEAI